MALTFQQILIATYPTEFNQGLFRFTCIDDQIILDSWNVPNVPRLTYEQVMALDTPELENAYNVKAFFDAFPLFLQNYIDSVAIARQYDNSFACISYINSTNVAWSNDAKAFNSWRDSVWNYVIAQQALIEAGSRPIPTDMTALLAELPVITWPS